MTFIHQPWMILILMQSKDCQLVDLIYLYSFYKFPRPMVMLVGQYSTGKTTFIRYLLEQDFPGIRIGPEPTTDRWVYILIWLH